MSEPEEYVGRELAIHDPFILPDELELEHEIRRPKWWYAQQLRLAGASWDDVAEALGYQTGATAHATVKRQLTVHEVARQSRDELVSLDLERLDMLQLVHWRAARQGDLKATEMVLKIMAMRAKYLGLDQQVYEEESTASTMIMIGGSEDEYIEAVKRAQSLHVKPIEGEIAS